MIRNVLNTVPRINFQIISVRNAQKKFPKVDKRLQASAESLAARGFLRPTKPWDPPSDIKETILKICAANGLNSESDFESLEVKYVVLKSCFEETGYDVPNSTLHAIESVYDLTEFYSTPVETKTPFDALVKMDRPKNLQIQENYVRFHPDTDPLFNGVSAFPKSSTLVTGLKSKKKYQGYSAKRSWP